MVEREDWGGKSRKSLRNICTLYSTWEPSSAIKSRWWTFMIQLCTKIYREWVYSEYRDRSYQHFSSEKWHHTYLHTAPCNAHDHIKMHQTSDRWPVSTNYAQKCREDGYTVSIEFVHFGIFERRIHNRVTYPHHLASFMIAYKVTHSRWRTWMDQLCTKI